MFKNIFLIMQTQNVIGQFKFIILSQITLNILLVLLEEHLFITSRTLPKH